MEILKKEMSRKEFLKYAFGSAILLSVGSLGISLKEKTKSPVSGYGAGNYGK